MVLTPTPSSRRALALLCAGKPILLPSTTFRFSGCGTIRTWWTPMRSALRRVSRRRVRSHQCFCVGAVRRRPARDRVRSFPPYAPTLRENGYGRNHSYSRNIELRQYQIIMPSSEICLLGHPRFSKLLRTPKSKKTILSSLRMSRE